ncbi:hypothetical protein [Thauera sp.]|uniref:hypothetical protein n=1 Tax=Thauera sp. TaxID=1905334 RepID=UPI002CB042ED|nr:hypothetical protein [Thauera sp.]HRP22829.1 hypothetical protein [Thauera sp.]
MPIVYLQPSDLSAVQAAQVLDFLNRATSPAQLDRDIEFPGEPDIGLRLGQRLLDARAALGGQFTDIVQVRAIRLIGPERFTEICVAALGLDPLRWIELFYGGAPLAPQAETGLGVSIEVQPQAAWLGQPRTLRLRVSDLGGTPRAGVPVTVQCGLGRLVYMYGFRRLEGQAVTVLSGADGTAELELLTPPAEPLAENQQAALEHALARLDPHAPHPLELAPALRAIAEEYLRDRSYSLRSAIDLHVRDHREAMLDSVNPGRWRMAWPADSALVQADVLADEDSGTSLARAVRTLTWINWVGPWLSFMAELLADGDALARSLAATTAEGGAGGGPMLGRLLNLGQAHLAGHAGRAAEWLGRQQVTQTVDRFLGAGVDALAPAVRDDVVRQLGVAASGLTPRSLGSFTLADSTRSELDVRIDAVAQGNLARFEYLSALATDIDGKAAQVDRHMQELQTIATSVRQDRLTVDARSAEFNTRYAQFDARYADFDARYTDFDSRYTTFDSRYTQIDGRLNEFDTRYGQFSTDLTRFRTDLAGFDQNRVTLTDRINTVDSNLNSVVRLNNLRQRGG